MTTRGTPPSDFAGMELDALIPLPELLPGVAAYLTPGSDLLFVTKAGGFGDDRLVERILERFK